MGYESIIRDQLAETLDLIEPGLVLLKKEYPLPNAIGCKGYIDILATDSFNNYVIIEIKRSKESSRQTLQEILKYTGLIKLNFGAMDSELRSIIVSANWDELFVPFCELTEDRSISIKGFKALLNPDNTVSDLELVQPIKLAPNRRKIGKSYALYLYRKKQDRDKAIDQFFENSASAGIRDYLIVSISHEKETFNDVHYGLVYANNQLTRDQYSELLRNVEYLQVEEGAFDDYEDYLRYLQECLIELICGKIHYDVYDDGSPEKFEKALTAFGWQVEVITRFGLFKDDPRLTDEMLITEMRGLTGHNRLKYSHFGSSQQPDRIREIKENCIIPFTFFPKQQALIQKIVDHFSAQAQAKPYRIVINTFCLDSVFDALFRYMREDELGYLPIYSVFIDMIDEPLLYHFQGMLRWTGKPVDIKAFESFCETEDMDTIFNRPIDVIRGLHDEKVIRLLQLKWQIYGTAFSDEKIETEGVIGFSKSGDMKWSRLNSESILRWAQANGKLKKFMEKLYQDNTDYIG